MDANERGYALIGKPEDMHTWFFLYDESMREETDITEPMHNLNATYGNHTNYGHNGKHRVDLSASISVPNLDHSDSVGVMPPDQAAAAASSGHNYNYLGVVGNMHHFVANARHQPQPPVQPSQSQPQQPPPAPGPPPQVASNSHQQQAQHNFMMYGHAQSVHAGAPPLHP